MQGCQTPWFGCDDDLHTSSPVILIEKTDINVYKFKKKSNTLNIPNFIANHIHFCKVMTILYFSTMGMKKYVCFVLHVLILFPTTSTEEMKATLFTLL